MTSMKLTAVPVTLVVQLDGHGPSEVLTLTVPLKTGRFIHSADGIRGVGVVVDGAELGLMLLEMTDDLATTIKTLMERKD